MKGKVTATSTMTVSPGGNTLTFDDTDSCNAKGGRNVRGRIALNGDPSLPWVSVKRAGKDTLLQTVKEKGKVAGIVRMTVAPDGKTMSIVCTDPVCGEGVECGGGEAVKAADKLLMVRRPVE